MSKTNQVTQPTPQTGNAQGQGEVKPLPKPQPPKGQVIREGHVAKFRDAQRKLR